MIKSDRKLISCSDTPPRVRAYNPSLGLKTLETTAFACDRKQRREEKRKEGREGGREEKREEERKEGKKKQKTLE